MNSTIKSLIFIFLGALSPWVLYLITKDKMYFHDQSSVCVIAQGILSGLDMYRDYFNEKLPVLYYYFSFLMRFLTPDIESVRIISYSVLSITFALIYYLVSTVKNYLPLKIFIPLLSLFFLASSKSYNAATEPSLALIYLAVTLLVCHETFSKLTLRNFAVGILMGIALGFRQHSLMPALILLFIPWHKISRMYYLAGVVTGVLSWMLYFISHNLMNDLLWSTFFYAIDNPNLKSYIQPVGYFKSSFIIVLILFALATYAFKNSWKKWLPLFALSCSLSFFVRFGNTRLWPAFIVLLALLLIYLKNNHSSLKKMNDRYLRVGMIVLLLLAFPYKLYGEYQKSRFDESHHVAQFLMTHTKPHESILIYPGEPILHCLSFRKPSSKYYFISPWFVSDKVLETIARDIQIKKPKLILIRNDFVKDSTFQKVFDVINEHYLVNQDKPEINQYIVYRLSEN